MDSSIASRVPNEVLEKIFFETNPDREKTPFTPNYALTQLALVSKRFATLAQRELYRILYLGLERPDAVRALARLCDTIADKPALAANVRGIFYSLSSSAHAAENLFLAELVFKCPRLVDFEMNQWAPNTTVLIDALTHCKTLQSVRITGDEGDIYGDTPFCRVSKFWALLQGWPDLRRVVVEPILALDIRSRANAPPPTVTPDACSSLIFVNLEAVPMHDENLRILSAIAPHLAVLTIHDNTMELAEMVPPPTTQTLSAALVRWKHSLTSLEIAPEMGDNLDPHLHPILSTMPQLRSLSLRSSHLAPLSLASGFPVLSALKFTIEAGQVGEVLSSLRAQGGLPALRKLRIRFSESNQRADDSVLEELQDVCDERDIQLDCPGL
ncbi:hypothetical protein FA95DRAFT_1567271 [Auriscalpium vulgare]|uniref:Uncharacterized protein n=1 Tax=Auriscalpium vulgare TaxID=40419 RepID=A0ACB8R536_9AGAM|nr:hypothetical protein FA95DRAFT_1567271 [Auriscalpium vulgare]